MHTLKSINLTVKFKISFFEFDRGSLRFFDYPEGWVS